jgi:cutinase
MNIRKIVVSIGFSVVVAGTLLSTPIGLPAPPAGADPCPDVEVVFARGTTEPPGLGGVGQAFVDAVRAQVGGRSVEVYPVQYPASTDFPTAAQGVLDATARIRATAANCPKTKMILGGYSQGAAVMGYVTAAEVPDGYAAPAGITGPMPSGLADHVAAVALFGEPSTRFLDAINAPPITIGPLYAPKTIAQCIPDDPICSLDGGDIAAHGEYAANGMVDEAASFAIGRLGRE